MRSRTWALAIAVTAAVLLVACGDDGDRSATTLPATDVPPATETPPATEAPEQATTVPEVEPLRILVANDDGIGHPAFDLLVRELLALPDVEVTVVAPAENMSGSSDRTTPGGAPHGPGATASGVEGTAVDGFPADAVLVALDELGLEPHLVVSGINDTQNIGPIARISGTVGVARTAIRRGVPGVAVSAGTEFNEPEFSLAAALVVGWITEHRDALVTGTHPTDHAVSFNVPSCPIDQIGDVVEVPLADAFVEGVGPFEFDCTLSDPDPANDHAAIHAGYPALTRVPADFPE